MAPAPKRKMLQELRQEIEPYRPDVEDAASGTFEYHRYSSRKVNSLGGRPRKRPSIHDPGIFEAICHRIIMGDGILSILDDKECKFPTRREFYKETCYNPNSKFSLGIKLAREASHYAINDLCRQMAESITPANKDAVKAKLEWFRWHLGNLFPEIYGEKRMLNFANANEKAPVELNKSEFEDIAYKIVDEV